MVDFEEFQESDVMFSDYSSEQISNENNKDEKRSSNGSSRMTRLKSKKSIPKIQRGISSSSSSSSLPVNIPSRDNSFRYDDVDVECSEQFDEDSDDNVDKGMRLPPHIIVERRFSGEIARSFSPLKGRNLSQVRDSIHRITGFLER